MSSQDWGRVDDAGNVYVRVADEERLIASWQAGPPEEGLSFYQRRFDGLNAEVTLLEKRLKAGGVDPETALGTIARLKEQVAAGAAVGDLATLDRRLDAAVALVDQRKEAVKEERKADKAKALANREAMVIEAEKLGISKTWKVSGDRFRDLLEEWKNAPRVDRSTEQAMWKRFSAARTSFDRARRSHFAALDVEREKAKVIKARLADEAEALTTSADLAETSRRYRDLMAQWKTAGRAGKGDDEILWQRFKAAQDAFFARKNEKDAEQGMEHAANLAAKQELAAKAEALLPITDIGSAKAALRDISKAWEAIGHVPRDDKAKIEQRLKKVEDAARNAEQELWKRQDPAARARSQDAVDQLLGVIAKLEKQRDAASAKGDQRGVDQANESITARQEWLLQAQSALAEFSQ
ncbi:MAG: DUF349 domain-containing protein [Actinobacteria bacterium]|nr:DUF349 domain-containing protein [Actinomycetota bacterium]